MNISPYFSPLFRQRINEDMTMRKLATKTQIAYIRGVNRLCKHFIHRKQLLKKSYANFNYLWLITEFRA
jgi:integrase/recombinase XerD